MATIFLSYSHHDQEIAKKIYEYLSSKGFNIWLDREELRPGDNWSMKLQEALVNSQLLLLLMSPASLQSREIAWEYQSYIQQNKLLIPILIAGTARDIPVRLQTYPFLDLRNASHDNLEHLATRLQEMLERGNILESSGKKQITITFDVDGDTDLANIVTQIARLKGAHDVRVIESEV